MKQLFIAAVCLGLGWQTTFAQQFEQLDINSQQAGVLMNGRLFSNEGFVGVQGLESPAGSGITSLFSSQFWMAGQNVNGQVYTAYYGENLVLPGPISDDPANIPADYQRVWKINRSDIDYHIGVYDGSIVDPGYVVPPIIVNWPAHGDVSLGMNFMLAPFADLNNNGIYEPLMGEYPKIYGDQSIFFVFNDQGPDRINPMSIEVHGQLYAFDCASDEALANSVFVHYDVYNRSNSTYGDVWMGQFSDANLGNPEDNFVECDVDLGAYFFKNGDDIDDSVNNPINNFPGYEDVLAAQGVVFLAGPQMEPNGMDDLPVINADASQANGFGFDDGIVDNERLGMARFMAFESSLLGNPGTTFPSTPVEYYNYLRGYWRDSSPLMYGGTGHPLDPGTSDFAASYLFPHVSHPPLIDSMGNAIAADFWSEDSLQNLPGFRNGLGTTGPFVFGPEGKTEMDLAFVFGRSQSAPDITGSVATLKSRISDVRTYFQDGASMCSNAFPTGIDELVTLNVAAYPNPASHALTVEVAADAWSYDIVDLLGKRVANGTANQPKESIDITTLENGIYLLNVTVNNQNGQLKFIKN